MRLGKDKQAILLAVFLLLSASSGGQAGKIHKYHFNGDLQKGDVITGEQSLIINYSISELDIENITNENGSFYRILIPGHTSTSNPGKPELPVLSRLITLPGNSSYQIRISEVKSTKLKPSVDKIEGVLFPSQESETKRVQDNKPAFAYDKALYKSRGLIKSDTVTIEPLGTVRNKRLANLIISPLRYNPKSNLIEVITSMKIEITFSQPGGIISKSSYPESALFTESLSKGVLNYITGDLITGYSDKPVKMIILTDTTFLKLLQPFLKWKTQKGFNLKVLTVGAKYAGTTYTQIKDTLSKIYHASSAGDPPPEYLLIIGDVTKVPYYGTGNVTDMYYGEFDGNGDYIPEMFIGRLPVADTTELKSVVEKIIQYEKFEFSTANKFYSNALATTGSDIDHKDFMNGQVKYAVENYLTTANKINEQHFYYSSPYTSPKDSVIKLINKGTSFINYTGHGLADIWQHLEINVNDVANLTNKNMYPFIISNACLTSQFNITSLGNKMVLASEKGAIGFIGCSNDSYWDEDFYWAVGLGDPKVSPTYMNTGLGAYDRLFHTHSELPGDWYITMGQVIYAGNLAVSSSTSTYKKYYWETYNLVGDPSIVPIIGRPDSFNIALPDTLPNGIKTLTINSVPFSYIAISHFDTLWDASYSSQSGSVTLDLPGISDDSCLVVITGQNRIPVIKTIYISKINEGFLNLTKTKINDNAGNQNGLADFGETFVLELTIANLGLTDAEGVTAKLSSTSPWVTINQSSVSVGNVPAGSEIVLSDKFSIALSNLVPDNEIISFELILSDLISEKHYNINITSHAPKLEILSCTIDDSQPGGNKNYIADPGESINLIFQVRNLGSSNTSGQFKISTANGEISFPDTANVKSGLIQFGSTTEIVIPVKLSDNAAIGTLISIFFSLDCNPYIVDKNFSFRVGRIRESFESSSFNVFPWINVSPVPWTITQAGSYEGNLSARSGTIVHNGSTKLEIRAIFPQADSIKFYYKVSSELNFDFLEFRLNDKEIFKASGETGWQKKAIPVPEGINKMEWIYTKDANTYVGADAAWIDLIDFSAAASVSFIQRDIEIAKIVSPVQNDQIGNEQISINVLNVGHDTINGFYLAYTINNLSPVTQFFEIKLLPKPDPVNVTFSIKANLSKYGIYNITVFSYNNNDDYLSNDTLKMSIENNVIDEPLLVFPNPFTDQLNIVIISPVTDIIRITLVSVSGKTLYTVNKNIIKGENVITIDDGDVRLVPSLYYLNIIARSIKKSIPVIKIRH